MSNCTGPKSADGCISITMRFILVITSTLCSLIAGGLLSCGVIILLGTSQFDVRSTDGSTWVIIGLAVYQIVLALIGVVAAATGCRNMLRWFALFAGLNVLSVFLVAMYVSPRLDDGAEKITSVLEAEQAKVDWFVDPSGASASDNAEVRQATVQWSETQTFLQCCGLRNYEDWKNFEPMKEKSGSIFPSTCCPPQNVTQLGTRFLCRDNESLYKTPCGKSIQVVASATSLMANMLVWLNLLACAIVNVIIHCRRKVDRPDCRLILAL